MKRKLTVRRLFNYFLGGLIIVLPAALTLYTIYWIFTTLDGLLDAKSIIGSSIPGLGILLTIALITFIGFIAQGFIVKPILDFLDHLMENTPGIKVLYSLIKEFTEAFVGDKKKFTEPVAVEMTNGLYKLGFVTTKDLSKIELEGLVAVYFPHSYNFSGNVFLVPKDKLKHVPGNSSSIMKFIASGGVTDLSDIDKEPQEKKP